jgi:hypothetical protein
MSRQESRLMLVIALSVVVVIGLVLAYQAVV